MHDHHKKAPTGRKQSWLRAYARGFAKGGLRGMLQELRGWSISEEEAQDTRKKTYLNSQDGPMYWLGEQIVKRMEKAGYPSRIFCGYRSPDDQEAAFARGASKARAFRSPHQYYEAVDIIHKTKAWNVSQNYWDTLAAVVRVVEREYKVDLVHGYDWGWDSAHIEFADWRQVRDRVGRRVPHQSELQERFKEKLPAVYASLQRNKRKA